MSGEINRVPAALLSLLDMKARGNSPRDLSGTLTATIDLFDLYTLDRRVVAVGQAGPITSVGGFFDSSSPQATLVPQNEYWYVHHVTCRALAPLNGATGALVFRPFWRTVNQRIHVLGEIAASQVWTNGDRPSANYERPFWMGPGDVLGVAVERFAAFTVAPDIAIETLITRFAA